LKGKQGVMVGRKRLGDDGITWPEGGNINMMHGDSRVMVVVCLETASLPAPCLSTSTFPGSREEPHFCPELITNQPFSIRHKSSSGIVTIGYMIAPFGIGSYYLNFRNILKIAYQESNL
ncbi:hypothetical protein, partial [Aeromonas caviae]|uniref:hypothetical protein n=1 Tax=Aeromonas caviae TaxID=648 RepID=UPI00191EECA4